MKKHFDPTNHWPILLPLLSELDACTDLNEKKYAQIIKKYTFDQGKLFSKDQLISAIRSLGSDYELQTNPEDLIAKIKMKPTRTLSGVAPITILTKPFPCPGKCIFCPSDIRMPKSYLADEPGAQRAERNYFDPYLQTYNRLQALHNIGHHVDKAEIIVLGGTWSYYPEKYQIWFIKEAFKALNDFSTQVDGRKNVEQHYLEMNKKLQQSHQLALSDDPEQNKKHTAKHDISGEKINKSYNQTVSELYVAPERIGGFDKYQSADWDELLSEQKKNETATVRNVGLVIETRPDNISKEEVIRIRKLGCTKTQIGVQSLNDHVLTQNHRGHDVAATRRAFKLLRQAGFKIHAHWMANLYGSNVEADKKDYEQLFADEDFRPDELKIYPCSLINSAELMQYYKDGRWQPYSQSELLDVLVYVMTHTPQYCRLTRVIRDIPSTDIVEGNKLTNFRQIVEKKIKQSKTKSHDIRSREIREESTASTQLKLDVIEYQTSTGSEHFLQFVTPENKIVAFLRLCLPRFTQEKSLIEELKGSAIIREVHVYGSLAQLGSKDQAKSQHSGWGTQLIETAKKIAWKKGYKKIAVISAVGTREYYRKRGFTDGELYQFAVPVAGN